LELGPYRVIDVSMRWNLYQNR